MLKERYLRLLNSKLLQNSIWLFCLQIFNTVVPMLTIPYITRVLGATEYGVFSIALNWILYFQVFVEYGFGLTGARKVALAKSQEELNDLYNSIITARIWLLLLSFLLMNLVAFMLHVDKSRYLCMLVLFLMVLGTTFQLTWLFQGKQSMKFITIINAIARTISVILIFLVVKSKKDIYLYCLFYSATYCISSVISMYLARKQYNLRFYFISWKKAWNEIQDGKYLFTSSAMANIFGSFGVTVLGFVASDALVGIYSAIYKIPYVLTMLFSPISQALYPYNSIELKKDYRNGVIKIRNRSFYIFSAFLVLALGIIFLRFPIVNLILGKEYGKYSDLVIPLGIQFLFAVINNFLGIQVLVASGNQKRYSKAFVFGFTIMLILNFVLGWNFSIYGISVAALVGEIALTISLLYQVYIILDRK